MALRDAVSTTFQVSLLKPDLFIDNPNQSGRPKRKRRNIDRLGISVDKSNCNNSVEVIDSKLPTQLSTDVIQSGALIGEVCRMAWEFVTDKLEPNQYKEAPFERFYKIALKVQFADTNKFSYLETLSIYERLCLTEFKALDVQDRRFNFITPTKRLS
jgi:hypothetical protein